MSIPELDFEVQSATLGGRFTTIEGLLQQVGDQLKESNPFAVGDSSHNAKLNQFLEKLAEVEVCKRGQLVFDSHKQYLSQLLVLFANGTPVNCSAHLRIMG